MPSAPVSLVPAPTMTGGHAGRHGPVHATAFPSGPVSVSTVCPLSVTTTRPTVGRDATTTTALPPDAGLAVDADVLDELLLSSELHAASATIARTLTARNTGVRRIFILRGIGHPRVRLRAVRGLDPSEAADPLAAPPR